MDSDSSIPLNLEQCQKLLLAAGMLAAVVVVLLFWALPQLVDMACTNITREQRHLACPAQSCFCTDCDPSNMLLNMFLRRLWGSPADAVSPHWRPMRPWQDFSCKLGIDLNRCGITLLFNFLWLGLTLRLAWRVRSLLRKGSAQTRLLHVAGIICRLCATTAVPMLKPLLPNSIRMAIVTLKYEAINTLLLAASLFGPLGLLLRPKNPYHLKVPKGDDKRYDSLAADFLKSFLIFAFVGEMGIMLLAASTDSTGDKVVVQQHLFYSIYLLLGLLVVYLHRWNLAQEDRKTHDNLRQVLWQLLIVKLVWLAFRFLFWRGACSKYRTLAIKYDFFMVLIERTGVLWTVWLLVEFAQHVHKVQLSSCMQIPGSGV